MIQFNINRFLNVARWDVTLNRRFYINQATGILLLATVPVLLRYLLWWAEGQISLTGMGLEQVLDMAYAQQSFADNMGIFYSFVSGVLPVVGLGYMFHNLATRRGRTAELTLPASNVERFLWHALFWALAPMLAFLCSTLLADLLQVLLSVVFGCHAGLHSLTVAWLTNSPAQADSFMNGLPNIFAVGAVYLSGLCFTSTFALGNAWKYRYNLIYTVLAHMGFWISLVALIMFLAGLLSQVFDLNALGVWLDLHLTADPDTVGRVCSVLAFLFNLALLAGIWALTYRLYCHAQITTRRNK